MQYRSLSVVTEPAAEPVSVAEAKAHLRVDTSDDDAYIGTLIAAAREWVQAYLDRALVTQQLTVKMDTFPDEIELPRPPVASGGTLTATTVTYTLASGSTTAMSASDYRVDREATPGVVRTVYAGTWPTHLADSNAVSVTWWAGYGDASDVPAAIRHAMLMLVSHWYDGARSGVLVGSISKEVELGVKALLDSQKWGSYR